ncbi:CheY-P phosphatase CheC [Pelotomaculum schinkii]|uniref:CheY-P phosphatase CheC n=1 Tax=Pelotomaculum schinkii TaxID=78350 RepID=A0A4Y7R7M1_9FIRM|nr:chemotaxis protein CheC [Pelotomaculum schinkii]TEB04958.1 CheY-P phosphatase CheC [Pelotomaculum schinkii]
MSERIEMSYSHLDVLQEISNIGLGNAATALAELLKKKVNIAVPHATFLEMEQVFPLVGGLEEVVACVNLSFDGDVAGTVMYIFAEKSVYKLVDMLLGQEIGATGELNALGESVIMEIGNILTGSFMNALGSMTGLTMQTSVPLFAFDMMGAILSASLVASGHWDEQVLLIETIFLQNNDQIKGHFFLLPETGALNRLFEALGIPA